MLHYQTNGLGLPMIFTGRSAKEVVQQMHRAAWLLPSRKSDYMRQVAQRVAEIMNGEITYEGIRVTTNKDFLDALGGVDISTPQTFLDSLARLGFLVKLD